MIKKLKAKINSLRLNVNAAIRNYELSKSIDLKNVDHLFPTIDLGDKPKWYGNSYGGFYIYPDILSENSIIYSFGIGKDISFDTDLIKKHKCKVFGFDPTPKSINWINEQKLSKCFSFFEYGLGVKTEVVNFFLPKNSNQTSGSIVNLDFTSDDNKLPVQLKSLDDIMKELNHKHLDVLKMDIEGAEYDVIEHILSLPVKIDQILIEFHDRCYNETEIKSRQSVEKFEAAGYKIFAVSSTYEEVSLIHKDILS